MFYTFDIFPKSLFSHGFIGDIYECREFGRYLHPSVWFKPHSIASKRPHSLTRLRVSIVQLCVLLPAFAAYRTLKVMVVWGQVFI
jgi:hypothetical protein